MRWNTKFLFKLLLCNLLYVISHLFSMHKSLIYLTISLCTISPFPCANLNSHITKLLASIKKTENLNKQSRGRTGTSVVPDTKGRLVEPNKNQKSQTQPRLTWGIWKDPPEASKTRVRVWVSHGCQQTGKTLGRDSKSAKRKAVWPILFYRMVW